MGRGGSEGGKEEEERRRVLLCFMFPIYNQGGGGECGEVRRKREG